MYVSYESTFMCMRLWTAIYDEIVAVRIGIRLKFKVRSFSYEVSFSEKSGLIYF